MPSSKRIELAARCPAIMLAVPLITACASDDDRPKLDFSCTASCFRLSDNSHSAVEQMSIRAPNDDEARTACFDAHGDCPKNAGYIEKCTCESK